MLVSGFTAYKCLNNGVTGGFSEGPLKVIFDKLTMIDNAGGFTAGVAGTDSKYLEVKYTNNHVYGQSGISDCYDASGDCFRGNKTGINQNSIGNAKSIHPASLGGLPYQKVRGTKWYGKFVYEDNTFYNFQASTPTGGK